MKKQIWDNVFWNHSVSRYSGSRYVIYPNGIRSGYAECHYIDTWLPSHCKSTYYIV